tara:strand:+ start:10741 stop:10977 length:237 start_codon:yes stop_codon:yes gene_type:complete
VTFKVACSHLYHGIYTFYAGPYGLIMNLVGTKISVPVGEELIIDLHNDDCFDLARVQLKLLEKMIMKVEGLESPLLNE